MIQSCRFSFTGFKSIYQNFLNSMLTFQVILPVSALLALSPLNFLPPLADLTWSCMVSKDSIYLFELTVPTNTQQHLLAARARKEDRYGSLLYDLQRTGLVVDLISIEIGCLGHFMPETLAQVNTACCVSKKTVRSLFEQAARIAISCSYRSFNSRASPEWDLLDLLT